MVCQFWNLLPLHLNREDELKEHDKNHWRLLWESDAHNVQFFINMFIFICHYAFLAFAITCLCILVLINP